MKYSFMVGGHHSMKFYIKGQSLRRIENQCPSPFLSPSAPWLLQEMER